MILPSEIEQAALRAFPATTTARVGEWVLRSDALLPNRRVNSAWDLGHPGLPLADAVSHVCGWYADRGRRAIVKTEPGSPVDRLLGTWETQAPTGVHVRRTVRIADHGVTLLARDRLAEWSSAFATVRGFDASRAEGLTEAYRSLPDLGLALVADHAGPIAVGLGVLDGEWIGLFDVATTVRERRRGLGSRVTSALIAWGHDRGAHTAYLQVEEENAAAIALYGGLGFSRSHGYHYRVDRTGSRRTPTRTG